MSKCQINKRMKEFYEGPCKTKLLRKTPVICKLDGKAFHTYTKNLDKPFDEGLIEDMQQTAIFLCENIQGAKCAYTQSDEISILVTDFDKLETDAWFDYNIQKIASISASFATAKFNDLRRKRFYDKFEDAAHLCEHAVDQNITNLAFFDSRVFNIPKEEVSNYFLARQKDAVKNSISMLAQSLYSHKILHKKNSSEMQEMCFQKGQNWNDLHFSKKRGSWVIKNEYWNGQLTRLNLVDGRRYTNTLMENNTTDSISHQAKNEIYPKSSIKIRTKWEVVETPLKFTTEVFKDLLKTSTE